MPTIGTLTRRIAEAMGVEEKTVTVFVRRLREEEWLTTGARGVNAPSMNYLDAARIVLALLVTDKPSAACDAISDFGSLVLDRTDKREQSDDVRNLEAAVDGEKLENFVAALIQLYADAPALHDIACELRVKPGAATVQLKLQGQIYIFTHEKLVRPLPKDDDAASKGLVLSFEEGMRVQRRWKSRIQVERYIRTSEFDGIAAAFKARPSSSK